MRSLHLPALVAKHIEPACLNFCPSPPPHEQVRWHEAALERHHADLAALQAMQDDLAERFSCRGSRRGHPLPPPPQQQSPAASAGAAMGDLLGFEGQADHLLTPAAAAIQQPDLERPWGGSGEAHPPVMGRAVMQLQRGTPSELEEVEARAADEAEWGTVLQVGQAQWRGREAERQWDVHGPAWGWLL